MAPHPSFLPPHRDCRPLGHAGPRPGLPAEVGPTYAIRNAKVVPVAGPVIEKGTLVIRDGLIEVIGPIDKVAIPEDAEIVEAEGLTAYPGLISAHTNLLLEEPVRPPGSAAAAAARLPDIAFGGAEGPAQPPGKCGGPGLKLLKPKKTTIDAFLKIGVTTVWSPRTPGSSRARASS